MLRPLPLGNFPLHKRRAIAYFRASVPHRHASHLLHPHAIITWPVEEALKGIPGAIGVRSVIWNVSARPMNRFVRISKAPRSCRAWRLHLANRLEMLGRNGCDISNGNPLDDVTCYPALPSVVKTSGPWIGVAGQKLHVVQRNALLQQVGDRRRPKRMR